jgi:hypothetical protein
LSLHHFQAGPAKTGSVTATIEIVIIATLSMFIGRMDLSRFDAARLIAFTATKEMNYGTETDGRI